jgi:hypothetical protein
LRGQHEQRVETPLTNEDRRFLAADVEMLEPRAGGNVRAFAVGEVVDDDDVVIRRDQSRGDMGPDESGPTGDKCASGQGIFAVTRARIPWATPA